MKNRPYKIYHVVAMADDRVIGLNNKLPWHFSADLKFFKELTLGQTVIMGRKTYESIGRPLPGRQNFVLSRKAGAEPPQGIRLFSRLTDAFDAVSTEKAFVIGGAEIFRETLSEVDGIYLTRIHAAYPGDTYYPEIPPAFKPRPVAELQAEPRLEVLLFENTKIQ